MIKYTCAHCGAKLETDDSLSGKQETCPACRKANPVPLSKQDLADDKKWRKEEQRKQKEKLRQEQAESLPKERAEQEEKQGQPDIPYALLRAAERKRGPQPAPQVPPMVPQQRTLTQASLTETVFCILGCICVAIGIVVGAFFFVACLRAEDLMLLMFAVASVVGGFLAGMPYFAVQLVLRYLRSIMNAAERGK